MAKRYLDPEILRAALVGLEQQKLEIDRRMAEVRKWLGAGTTSAANVSGTTTRKGRRLSAAIRKRMAAAQQKRWAEYRKAQGK